MPPVANVIMPERMRRMKRDRRGYPIPYIVYRDKKNKPHFTVNDAKLVKRCIHHNRCGICGEKLGEVIFFVGGPAAALHPNGAYVDPPMHEDCARYALQVCPFLAIRKYQGEKATYVYEDNDNIMADSGVMKGKPGIFVLKATHGFVNMGKDTQPRMVPTDTVDLWFWKDGKQLDEGDPVVILAIEEALGAVDETKAAAHTPILRTPMQTSMAAFAPMIRR